MTDSDNPCADIEAGPLGPGEFREWAIDDWQIDGVLRRGDRRIILTPSAVDIADEIIDAQFVAAVEALSTAERALAAAEAAVRSCKAAVAIERTAMLDEAQRLGADNAVVGRRVPDLRDAAYRRLQIRQYAPRSDS